MKRCLTALLVLLMTALTLALSSCKSCTPTARVDPNSVYWPIFPNPVDSDGRPYAECFTADKDGKPLNKEWIYRHRAYYNEETGNITIPYRELEGLVFMPYDFYFKWLRYSADTEAAVKAVTR